MENEFNTPETEYNLYPVNSDENINQQNSDEDLTNQMLFPLPHEPEEPETEFNRKKTSLKDRVTQTSQYEGAELRNASVMDTVKDVGKGVVEGLVDGAVVGSWAGLVADENTINVFETQTAAGDFVRTATKYITAGALAFTSGSALGLGTKAVAKYAGKRMLGRTARVMLGKRALYKGENAVADILFNKIFNPKNMVAGAYADFTAYSPEEGHLADILTENNIHIPVPYADKITEFLSSNENDSISEAKLKNVLEGALLTPFVALGTDVILPNVLKGFKKIKVGKYNKSIGEVIEGMKEVDTGLKQHDLLNNVYKAFERAYKEEKDVQEVVRELVPDNQYAQADFLIENIQKGNKLGLDVDGNFNIAVDNWKDAYKIPLNDYQSRFKNQYVDIEKGFKINEQSLPHNLSRSKPRYNSQKINFQSDIDKALYIIRNRSTKSKAHDEFMSYLSNVFPDISEKDLRNLGDRIFEDFKEIAKTSKDDEIIFPKTFNKYIKETKGKSLPKSLVELENGYNEILHERGLGRLDYESDLEHFNRIKEHYAEKFNLPEFNNVPVNIVKQVKRGSKKFGRTFVDDKTGLLTINIKSDAPNKLSVLRAELEHARDYMTGEYKNKIGKQEFFRYADDNEGEWAVSYLHKKSVSRAIREGKEIPADVLEQYKEFNPHISNETNQVADPAENIKVKLAEKQKKTEQLKLNFVEYHNGLNKEIAQSKTADEAVEKVGEALTKEGAFSSPEIVKETIETLAQKIKTRTFDEAVSKAQQFEEFISTHLDVDNFNTDELKKIVSDTFGKSEKVSDTLLAFCEVLYKIKSKTEELNKIIANNPNNVEAMEKLSNLLDTYSYIDKALLNERSHAGRTLNEIKLFNKAYNFYTNGEGFERVYTSSQKEEMKNLTELLSSSYKEAYDEFFTFKNRPPDVEELTDLICKKIMSKNPEIDVKKLDFERLKAYASHIQKAVEGLPSEEQDRLIRKYFKIYSKHDAMTIFAQGGSMSQTITGFHAFKKNFGSNLAHYYIGNILSSPGTQVANALSGVVNMLLENTSKFVAGTFLGHKALAVQASDTLAGYVKYLGESISMALHVLKTEKGIIADTRKYGIEINPFQPMERPDIKPLSFDSTGLGENWTWLKMPIDVTGGVLRGSGRIMSSFDEFLSQINYRGLAWADAMAEARGHEDVKKGLISVTNKAEELFNQENKYFTKSNQATNQKLLYETRKMIYQNPLNRRMVDPMSGEETKMEDTTWVSNFGNMFEQMRLHNPALKFVFPFIRTPFNILEQVMEYTPANLATQKYKSLEGAEKALANAKMAVGGAIIGISTMFAFNGSITGSMPTDDKQRRILSQSGWQPYSWVHINPDGTKSYLSYKRIEPLATIVGLGADIANLINMGLMSDGEIDQCVKQISLAILNNAVDKSYISQGLDILDLLTISNDGDMKKMQRVMNNFVGGFYPGSSAVNWFKNDEYIRDTRALVDAIAQRSIFRSNNGVMPSRNYFGEIRPLSNKMTNMLTRVTTQQDDNADRELIRLAQKGATITSVKRMLGNDNEIDMTTYRNAEGQTAYDKILETMSETKISGKTLRQAVNALIASPNYQKLPDGANEDEDQLYKSRKKAINALIQRYAQKAKREVLHNKEFVNDEQIDLNTSYKNWKRSRKYVLYNELQESF